MDDQKDKTDFQKALNEANEAFNELRTYCLSGRVLQLSRILELEKILDDANGNFKIAIKNYFSKEVEETGFEWS